MLLSIIAAFIVSQFATFCTTLYLHRCLTHKSFTLHPSVSLLMRFILWLTTGLNRKTWAGVHRKHHAYTDIIGDPHSPKLVGFLRVQFGNVVYYRRAASDRITIEKYTQDIKEDSWDKIFNLGGGGIGPMIGTMLLCLLLGVTYGLLAAIVHLILYVFILSSSINGLGHSYGYKNFPNTATNIWSLALFTAGESNHNNHHADLSSPKFSVRWWEVDLGWRIIKILSYLKLCTTKKTFLVETSNFLR